MHDRGPERVDLARVRLLFDKLPRCPITFPDLVLVEEITRVLNQPGEEVVVNGQLFPAPFVQGRGTTFSPFLQ